MTSLVTLEYYLLRALSRWTELRLATKAQRGELVGDDAALAGRALEKYVSSARTALREISRADSQIRGRRWWEQLVTHGVVIGAARDDDIKRGAIERRKEIQAEIGAHRLLPRNSRKRLHLTLSDDMVPVFGEAPRTLAAS